MKVIRFNAYIHGRGSKHRHIPPAFSTRSLSVPNELYLRIFRNLQKSINKIYIDELEFALRNLLYFYCGVTLLKKNI